MQLFRSILDFVYPPICIHCKSFLTAKHSQLCCSCFEELRLQDTLERCTRCFIPLDQPHRCPTSPLNGLFACLLDSELSRNLLYSNSSALSAFLIYQWSLLPWPAPDVITITPGNKYVDRLLPIRERVAKEFAFLMNRTFVPSAHIFQEHLSNPFSSLENQAQPQDPRCILMHTPQCYINKKVFVIHDILSSAIALSTTATAIKHIGALEVYGLCTLYN